MKKYFREVLIAKCTIGVEGELTKTFEIKSGACRMNGTIEAQNAGKPASFVAVDENDKVVPSDTGVATPSKANCAHAE